ncbi:MULTISPECIES: hypothetical protein [Flammeovirga]|uniref:Uncharacterized protein n=1 Tax=Flammeovirga agarivorans TaxID=2726742 RepID=A0A7X8XU73_9BACT|nr:MULTISPECIES: hypothetical protein [Flammeovirga]NLR90076.1 hypothetical protein [Flammeovirga agarivorans]
MILLHQISLEGELKYSDINTPVFLKVSYKNNQVRYEVDANGELLNEDERNTLLIVGIDQFVETRVYETFLTFRSEGNSATVQDYIDALTTEIPADMVYSKLMDLAIFNEENLMRVAS